ncbi:hypothetical protein [Phyllobacterium sp. SB3]|uniref:hypothetical protein n=1 Tax=Phyllobacterium sp. SB3 TaxID=3156073 RepID=UPI0032AFA019
MFLGALKLILGWFTGGTLSSILSTIDKHMQNKVTSEEVKADVTKTYVEAQARLLVGRTWWFQLFFVIPLGLWWTSVIIDSIFIHSDWYTHSTAALPAPLDTWAGWIISALFVVDGTKALLGRFGK